MQLPQINISKSKRIQYGCYQLLDHFFGRQLGVKLTKKSRKKYYKNLKRDFEKLPDGKLEPIDRVTEINVDDFYRNYVNKGLPVVIENGAKDWDCIKNWSLDYFKNLHGDDEIVMVDQHTMDLKYEKLTLKDIINGIKENVGRYYRFYPLLERHPEHMADFDVKWLRKFKKVYSPTESFQVFIGGDKSYTPLHNSSLSNLFIQVVGEKEWILYPNENVSVVDPDPVRNIYRHAPIRKNNQSVNAFEPDHGHPFDLYKKLNGISVRLKPGDIFYNPPYFWHTVRNVGDSIGVGYRWLPVAKNLKKWPLFTFMDLTVRSPNFFKTMKILKQDVNLLHLAETGELKEYLKRSKK